MAIAMQLRQTLLISAVSVPLRPTGINALSSSFLFANATELTVPAPPPGFKAKLSFDQKKPLNPLADTEILLSFMYSLATREWDFTINDYEPIYIAPPKFGAAAVVETGRSVRQQSQLRISHAILGLYTTALLIVQKAMFFECFVELLLHGKKIGVIEIFKPHQAIDLEDSTTAMTSPNVIIKNLTTQGSITDPADGGFKIIYQLHSHTIGSQEIFTAILAGLATAASHPENTQCARLKAESATGRIALHIYEITGSTRSLTYKRVKRALYLIWKDIVLVKDQFFEMSFGLEYDGKKIGVGSIVWLYVVEGTGAGSVAYE